jgi:hypothetical protein
LRRASPGPGSTPAAALDKRLVWEQDEQILDAAFPADRMLLPTPSNLVWFSRQDGQWTRSMSVALPAPKVWPRDLRGRLRIAGSKYRAYLPGLACVGAWQPPASLAGQPDDDPWVLESGSRGLLPANFAAGRNYFDGRVATQAGLRLEVSGAGQGLTREECERLFTPYYTPKTHGTGLGLAIVQSVVSDHGGRIPIENDRGKGTTFRIDLDG